MPASVASNFHHASRAEILADYVFSSWGTVTPARRNDDHGIDLYCTLTERIGQRSIVRAYYSVQVKSNSDPWIFKDEEEIRWVIEYPTPLFLACVDQNALVLSVYQTMPRYLAGMWPPGKQLEMVPSAADEGKCAQWEDGERFDLSAPIIRVSLEDIVRGDHMENFHRILRFWVDVDREAGELRRGFASFLDASSILCQSKSGGVQCPAGDDAPKRAASPARRTCGCGDTRLRW